MRPVYRSGKKLEEAVERYFRSISRTVPAVERRESGEKDSDGKKIFLEFPILNDDGEEIRYREYVIPPTVWGLCDHLGITRETWESWSDAEKFPQYHGAVQRARTLLQEWSQRSLLTKKDVRGLIYVLQNGMDGGAAEDAELPAEQLSLHSRRALLEALSEGEEE